MAILRFLATITFGLTVSTTMTFVAGPPNQSNSTLVVNPNTIVADGASTAAVRLVVRDAYNNLVPNGAITLSASGGNTTFGAASGSSDVNGLFQTSVSSTQVQVEQLTAVLGGNVTINTSVQFVAGPPVAANSRLNVAPANQTASNSNGIVATVTLLDSLQHPVSGILPSFTVSGSNTAVSTPTATNAAGQTSVTVTSTLAQSENVTVSTGSVSLTQPISFLPGPPTTAMSTLTASPNANIFANGSQAATLKITLMDQYGNVTANQNVAWSASSGNNTFTPAAGVSNAAGVLTTQMTSLTAGGRTVTGTSGAAGPTTNITFVPAATTATSSFVASPNQIAANGNAIAALTLTARDASNAKLSGVAVKLIDAVGNKVLTPSTGVTDSNGTFAATLTTTQTGLHNVTAQLTGISMTSSIKGTPLTANCNQTIRWGNPPWPNPSTSNSYAAAVYDFNGDGNQDLAVSDFGGHVQVMLGLGNRLFAPAVTYSVGSATTYMAMGDLNGDGNPDLVTSNAGSNTVSVLMGNSNGTFRTAASYAVGAVPRTVVISDLNGDSYADIATANQNANTVSVLFNAGNGIFATQQVFAAGNQPYGLVAGRISSPNTNDLMVTNAVVGTVSLLANAGGNTFAAPKSFAVGASPRSLALGDVDGDGKLDVVVSNASNSNISLLINQGNTAFASQKMYSIGASPIYVAVGPMNGNALPDIVALSTNNRQAYVLGNSGNGNFSLQYAVPTCSSPQGLNLYDADGDGKIDILLPNGSSTSSLPIAFNRGNYSFGTSTAYATGNAQAVLSGDYDADGNIDLFVLNYTGASYVYWGSATGSFSGPSTISTGSQPQAAAQGDLNADGLLDFAIPNSRDGTISVILNQNNRSFATQVVYAAQTSPISVAIADFDGNTTPDLAITNLGSNSVSFYSNLGNANFNGITPVFATGSSPRQIAIADYNADGFLDFAVTNSGDNNITFALNQNSFQFAAGSSVAVGATPKAIIAGDINGDGMPDIVVANAATSTLSILYNQNNVFTTYATTTVAYQPSALLYQDVNADGIADLIVSSMVDSAVSVLYGTTSGPFAKPVAYFSGNVGTIGVTLGDFDRDGHMDYATVSGQSQTLNVALYTGCQ